MDLPSFDDIFERGKNEVLAEQGLLSIASVSRDGSDANVLVAAGAAMADQNTLYLARMWRALFFSTAQGVDLDRLALDRYRLTRKGATSALGTVVFSAPSAPLVNVVIPANVLLTSTTGLQYQTTGSQVWLAGQLSSPPVPVASLLSGANQQTAINTITSITQPIAGYAPSGTTVTNVVATVGAADAENDQDFRARCITFPQTQLQGSTSALTQAALAVPGVETAACYETLNSTGQQTGVVELVIADAYTDELAELNVNPPTYQQQSQQLSVQVQQNLGNARAAGVYVYVYVAQVVLVQLQLSLSFSATDQYGNPTNVASAAQAARVAALNYVNNLAPGVELNPTAIAQVVSLVPGILACAVASPAGPIFPTTLQVIRTSLGLVTTGIAEGSIVSAVDATLPSAPYPPTNVTATPGLASATVTWTPSPNGFPAQSYKVQAIPGTVIVQTGLNSVTVTGLTSGTAYSFVVYSLNNGGSSAPSTPTAAVTPL